MKNLKSLKVRWMIVPIVAFAISRVFTLVGFWVGARMSGDGIIGHVVTSWDGAYCRDLATFGYPPVVQSVGHTLNAFFPLFPLLIRWTHDIFGVSIIHAGTLVTTFFGFTFVLALWKFTEELLDKDVANRAVVLAAFFPGTFVFSMQYSEPLFLTLAVLCLLFLQKKQWLLAGILGALATSARSGGVAIVAACAIASLIAIYRDRNWRSLVAPILSPFGTIIFFAYMKAHTGHWNAWLQAEKGWDERFDFGVNNLHRLHDGLLHPNADVNTTMGALGIVAFLIGFVFLIKWRPPAPVWVFALSVAIFTIGSHSVTARPRFILTAFPLIIAVAKYCKKDYYAMVAAGFACLLATCAVIVGGSVMITP